MCTLVTVRFPRPSWGSARVRFDLARLHFGVHLVPAEVGDLCVSAVGQKRVDGVMEITLAATTTPSDVAIPASFISDLRAAGPRPGG